MTDRRLLAWGLAGLLLLTGCGEPPPSEPASQEGGATGSETQDASGEDAEAPAIPDVDIYLLRLGGDAGLSPGPAVPVTDRPGYDNQPAFLADGSALIYSSQREDDQTDVWLYRLADGSHTRLTRTEESEYSPTPLDREGSFSTVRVEADGRQRLWLYDGGGAPARPILPDLTDIGYHSWLDDRSVALFRVQDPLRLEVVDIGTGEARHVADGIGRGLARMADGRLSFVDKSGEAWTLSAWDPATGETAVLTEVPEGSEDYAWQPDGEGLFMARGTVLKHWTPEGGWTDVADLAQQVQGPITRIAVSPDGTWMALVATAVEEGG